MEQETFTTRMFAVVVALAMVGAAITVGGVSVSAQSSPEITFEDPGDIEEGDSASAHLVATGVDDIGAYHVEVEYDSDYLSLTASGTDRFVVEDESNGDGERTIVGYTGETEDSGDVTLAEIDISGEGSTSDVKLEVTAIEEAVDTEGNDIDPIGIGDPVSFDVDTSGTGTPAQPADDDDVADDDDADDDVADDDDADDDVADDDDADDDVAVDDDADDDVAVDDDDDHDDAGPEEDDGTPGFGGAVSLMALLSAALLLIRR